MITDISILDSYPPIMTKEQFTKSCHISKRMAEYLLKSGLVPNKRLKKKTHSYIISKADIIAFVIDRTENPAKYVIPPKYDRRQRKRDVVYLSFGTVPRNVVREYYERQLKNEPDILPVRVIADFTGYTEKTVRRWITGNHLRVFCRDAGKYIISKSAFLDFLSSDYYNGIQLKTDRHLADLHSIMSR